jgi:hypothetical protein
MFTTEELEAARHVFTPAVRRAERAFDLDRCLDTYAAGLPRAETRTTQAWRTERWLEDWGCDARGRRFEGLLSAPEAAFWWVAWTLTGRLGDSADRAESVDLLRTVWEAESHQRWDREWCTTRLTRWKAAASDWYDVWALTSMSPAATMLRVLLGRAAALEFVLAEIPAERAAPWVEWVGAPTPDTTDVTDYRAVADQWAVAHQPTPETVATWRALALFSRSPEVVRTTRAFLRQAESLRGADDILEDLARADATQGSYSRWALEQTELPSPERAQEMVARDGDAGVTALAEVLSRLARRATGRRAAGAGALVDALNELPRLEFVEPMLELVDRPDTGVEAQNWLRTHGPDFLDDVIAVATGSSSARRAASELLADLRTLEPGRYDAAVSTLPEEMRARLDARMKPGRGRLDELTERPEWAQKLEQSWATQPPLDDVERALLPDLEVGQRRLPDDLIDGILSRLRDVRLEIDARSATSRDAVPADLERVREHVGAASADRFSRALYDLWLRADDKAGRRWCMRAVAFFAGDDTLDHVGESIRNYRKWVSPEEAMATLDAVRRQGSDHAVLLLAWLGLRHRAPRIRTHARLELEAMANELGVSVPTLLANRLPTFGFGQDGRLELHATAPSGGALELVLDSDGRIDWGEADRPPKRSGDDDAWANDRAWDELRALRRRATMLADVLADRWEEEMCQVRTRTYEAWHETVVEHPFARRLARSVLWSIHADDGGVLAAVRLGDDMELSGVDETPVAVQPFERIGIVHPAELTEHERRAWNRLFADYELVQPFAQLDRELYRPGSHAAFEPVDTQILRAKMAKHWSAVRGKNQMIVAFERRFDVLGIRARLELAKGFEIRPIAAGGLVPSKVEIDGIVFFDAYGSIPREAVPAGVYSEVVRSVVE